MNPTLFRDDPETFQALESLVTDNEGLKQQIIELNMLLSEARDEVEEVRVEIVEAKKDRWDGGKFMNMTLSVCLLTLMIQAIIILA